MQKTAILTWENLDVNVIPNTFDIKNLKKCFNKQETITKTNIIKNSKFFKQLNFDEFYLIYFKNKVSGIARPFEILAIMGASGSGKTSLLNTLNFRNMSSFKINGDIKVNGQPIDSLETISTISGYV